MTRRKRKPATGEHWARLHTGDRKPVILIHLGKDKWRITRGSESWDTVGKRNGWSLFWKKVGDRYREIQGELDEVRADTTGGG